VGMFTTVAGMARCAIFWQSFTREDDIEVHAFAPLEALSCV
jgi:hypothetical protein